MYGFRNIRRAAGYLALAAALVAPFGAVALAQDAPGWSMHGSLTLKGGSERHIGEMDLFVPVWQGNDFLLFGDLRMQSDDSGNQEGNIGFGYRRMGESMIVGGYGFYDYRKSDETGNTFMQGTLGLEALTETLDFRANFYIPEGGEQTAAGAAAAELVGASLQMRSGFERALPGFDAEIGYRLMGSENSDAELRVFAGGYRFAADTYETVSGARGRVEARLFDIGFLGEGSRFTAGLEVQSDTVRDTQGFAVARLTIPFGGGRRSARGGLERRMTDYVVRDVDVVTGTAATGAAEDVIYADTGVTAGFVYVQDVDDDFEATLAAIGEGGMVVLDGAAGLISTTASVALSSGQVLLGGGGSVDVVGVDSGATATWTAPGDRPFIYGDVAGGSVITLADDVVVSGLDIENISMVASSYGIYGTLVSGALVADNNIVTRGLSGVGIFLDGVDSAIVSGNDIVTALDAGYGIYLTGSDFNIVSGNSVATSGYSGRAIYLTTSSSNTVSGNDITTAGEWAVGVSVTGGAGNTLSGNNIVTQGVSGRGFTLENTTGNTVSGNSIATGQSDAYGIYDGWSDSNTGTGNSYSGPASACVLTGAINNTIDLCLP